jgi:protein SCO1/2
MPTVPRVAAAALALAAASVALAGAAGPAPPRLGAAPNFALTTQQNARVWLTHLRGRAVVLTFGCTTCGGCPGLLPGLRDLARSVGAAAGRQVFFAVVTVDPDRDTPSELRRFLREQGLDPYAWLLLTGTPAEIDVVTRRYEVTVRRDAARLRHDCLVVLIDPAGQIRGRYGLPDLAKLRTDLEGVRL